MSALPGETIKTEEFPDKILDCLAYGCCFYINKVTPDFLHSVWEYKREGPKYLT